MFNKLNINESKKKIIVYIALIAVTMIVYGQVIQYDFVNLDDYAYILENKYVQSGATPDGFRWALTTKYFGLWNPLVWLSLMFDYQIYGLNPTGYHVTNLLLHILSTLLLFWFVNRMTKETWKSAFVSAVFALHPLHVESVAWISERKDVLSAFFWMLTLCFYVYYTEKPVIKRYLLVLFSFILALMSKPMVITLPVMMILLDYWPLSRFPSQKSNLFLWQLKEKLPFFVLSVVTALINLYPSDSPFVGKNIPLSIRLANAPVSIMTYLEKTFWPHDMAVFYPFPNHIPLWQVLGATMLIIMISIAVISIAKRLPYLFVGWFWYIITLIPVIKLVPVGNDAMADRYHYLPSIGLAVMLAWGIPYLIKNKKFLFTASIAAIILLTVIARQQCGYWKDSLHLFIHALQVTEENYVAHANLATALAEKGNFNKAIYHYNKAIRMDPSAPINYGHRGKAFAELDKHDLAIADFNKAIALAPYYVDAYYNRGTSYAKTGQYRLAIDDFNKAIYMKPDYANVYNNRGIALDKLGLYQQAINDFNAVIHLKPNHVHAWNNRALSYLNQGNTVSGCADAKKACELGQCKALNSVKSRKLCN